MNRCTTPTRPRFAFAPRLLLAALLAVICLGTIAQTQVREFPKNALRGTLVVVAAPDITIDGNADRLAPGARIHDTHNMLVMTGTLVGQALEVNYTRESAGMVREVWILQPDEVRQKRARAASRDSSTLGSDYATRPDLQVPFNQLPRFPQ